MKTFEYAQTKNNTKSFKMPHIKTVNYDIPLLALPIAPFVIAYDKLKTWNYNRLEWNEEKATKVLDYFLPYVLEYIEEKNAYYYSTEWSYNGINVEKRVPFYLKRWTKKFRSQILRYLENGYENADFTKTIEKDFYDTWIKFEKKA